MPSECKELTVTVNRADDLHDEKKLIVGIRCKNPDRSIPHFLQRHLHLSTRPPKQCMFFFHFIW